MQENFNSLSQSWRRCFSQTENIFAKTSPPLRFSNLDSGVRTWDVYKISPRSKSSSTHWRIIWFLSMQPVGTFHTWHKFHLLWSVLFLLHLQPYCLSGRIHTGTDWSTLKEPWSASLSLFSAHFSSKGGYLLLTSMPQLFHVGTRKDKRQIKNSFWLWIGAM